MLSYAIRYTIFLNAIFFVVFYSVVDSSELLPLYVYSFFQFLAVSIFYLKRLRDNDSTFNSLNLKIEVGIISLIFVALNNYISYSYTGNFFVFSESDATNYDYLATNINNSTVSFFETLDRLGWGLVQYEDWGQIFLVTVLYKVWSSNLMLNFYYVILAIYGGNYLFLLCKNFMNDRYAYFASLVFYTSSFMFFFNSSGLKESQMIFLIIISFYYFYNYINRRSVISLFYCVLALVLLLFFRPAISLLIFFSFVIGYLFMIQTNKLVLLTLLVLFMGITLTNSFVQQQRERFFMEDFDQLVESRESDEMIIGSVQFTYFVNTVGSFFGHLPTINLNKIPPVKNLCSSGLSLKMALNIFFLFGVYFVIKNKYWILLPIVLFILVESISLISIFEALELRKSLPHYPMIYVLVFWFIYSLEKNSKTFYYEKFRKTYLNLFFVFNSILIVYWNLR
jgi:hypothetical protein